MKTAPFLLDPAYADFTPGVSELKFSTLDTYNIWGCAAGVTAFAFFCGSGFCLLITVLFFVLLPAPESASQPPADLAQSLLILFVVGLASVLISLYFVHMIGKSIRGQSQFRRLKERGRLMDGQVVSAKPQQRNSRFASYFYAVITFSFITPDGRTLTRKLAGYRPDLKNGLLPEPGTPVRVLYADDEAVIIL